mmetsp:Transcript_48633/g.128480  ORF Transcript_48633/g.128480 Transcript_48633/m.128480 type:complete len:264 (+) Transcript_48633:74-865(+)
MATPPLPSSRPTRSPTSAASPTSAVVDVVLGLLRGLALGPVLGGRVAGARRRPDEVAPHLAQVLDGAERVPVVVVVAFRRRLCAGTLHPLLGLDRLRQRPHAGSDVFDLRVKTSDHANQVHHVQCLRRALDALQAVDELLQGDLAVRPDQEGEEVVQVLEFHLQGAHHGPQVRRRQDSGELRLVEEAVAAAVQLLEHPHHLGLVLGLLLVLLVDDEVVVELRALDRLLDEDGLHHGEHGEAYHAPVDHEEETVARFNGVEQQP